MTSDAVASHPGTADVRPYVSRPGVSALASTQREAGLSRPLAVSASPVALGSGLVDLRGLGLRGLGLGLTQPSSA
ncbi:MAG: hypothetical protein Q8M79_09345 [Dehalococcoidia bacterium]|jgi:hypothetical protein|nr:hypothetical protein [Dehalococcoidia bacterium]